MKPFFREKVWGGRNMELYLGKSLPGRVPIGESWELSDAVEHHSRILGGPLSGKTLRDVLSTHATNVLGPVAGMMTPDGRFPLLYKFIDAVEDLSVQVHPSARTAVRFKNARPKTEAWYVVRAEEDSKIIAGVEPGMEPEQMKQLLEMGALGLIMEEVPVSAGDAIFIPGGTLHSIGKGVVLYEIQQTSDTTFRLHDFGRKGLDGKPRELHVEEGIAALDPAAPPVVTSRGKKVGENPDRVRLIENDFFVLEKLSFKATFTWPYHTDIPRVATSLDCRGSFEGKFGGIILAEGDTALMPISLGDMVYDVQKPGEMLVSWIPEQGQ